MFFDGVGVEKDLLVAEKWLSEAASAGSLDACHSLGRLLVKTLAACFCLQLIDLVSENLVLLTSVRTSAALRSERGQAARAVLARDDPVRTRGGERSQRRAVRARCVVATRRHRSVTTTRAHSNQPTCSRRRAARTRHRERSRPGASDALVQESRFSEPHSSRGEPRTNPVPGRAR